MQFFCIPTLKFPTNPKEKIWLIFGCDIQCFNVGQRSLTICLFSLLFCVSSDHIDIVVVVFFMSSEQPNNIWLRCKTQFYTLIVGLWQLPLLAYYLCCLSVCLWLFAFKWSSSSSHCCLFINNCVNRQTDNNESNVESQAYLPRYSPNQNKYEI